MSSIPKGNGIILMSRKEPNGLSTKKSLIALYTYKSLKAPKLQMEDESEE